MTVAVINRLRSQKLTDIPKILVNNIIYNPSFQVYNPDYLALNSTQQMFSDLMKIYNLTQQGVIDNIIVPRSLNAGGQLSNFNGVNVLITAAENSPIINYGNSLEFSGYCQGKNVPHKLAPILTEDLSYGAPNGTDYSTFLTDIQAWFV